MVKLYQLKKPLILQSTKTIQIWNTLLLPQIRWDLLTSVLSTPWIIAVMEAQQPSWSKYQTVGNVYMTKMENSFTERNKQYEKICYPFGNYNYLVNSNFCNIWNIELVSFWRYSNHSCFGKVDYFLLRNRMFVYSNFITYKKF